ncbi:phosphonopyruvate decarboxylase [Candidatus Nitronereus thalassa]|uniref:Phosphonopyruvate decarboxylase n=1 Tax=Candidatus Nitronereus thalassa TaxID=3020898 RepID=A0ABU3KDE1_9BACT|nr:phosphonopyruvate decarboxylase [Candidatus Nitronereus thalassa]MDT7044273.1 phosphonopyruvate decarboxylase [Candidatus Nitronereus thalassa]
MLNPEQFFECLQHHGVSFFTGVPDSLLKDFCACVTEKAAAHQHIISANEGGAVGLAVGYHLATGKIPLVYLQNSGVGNIINPLLSLGDPEVYAIPMLFVIGWRGEPGVHDEPQHKKQGRVMLPMLDSMEIPYAIVSLEMAEAEVAIKQALHEAHSNQGPYALIVRKGTFSSFQLQQPQTPAMELTREDAIREILEELGGQDIVVSTTGMPSREVFETRAHKNQGHQRDFLTVGGMGHASQIALGIALQKPHRQVFCLDGDGATLMHLGALAINGSLQPQNFHHIVLNNGAHDSVGGQPTVGFQVDFLQMAKAAGYQTTAQVQSAEGIKHELTTLRKSPGPHLLEIRVKKGARKDLGRPTLTPIENKQGFMRFLS